MNILPPKSLGDKGIQSVLQDLSKRKKLTKQPLPRPSEVLDRVAGYLADKGMLRKQARCWEGFEPVPGKKAYTDGSCRPKGEKKKPEKKAFLGPSIDLGMAGIPSGIGYALGHNRGKNKALNGEDISEPSLLGKSLKFLLMPGYTGYRFGKASGKAKAEDMERKRDKKDSEKKADTNIPLSPDESYLASQLIGKSLFSALQLAKEQELRKNILEEKGRGLGGENILRIPIPQHLLPSQKLANEQPMDHAASNPGVFARALKLNSHPVKKLMGMQGGFRDAKKEFFMREKEQIEKELMHAQKEYISLLERIKMGEERGEIKKAQETPCVDAFCNGIAYAALFEKDAEELPDLAPEIKDLFDKVASMMKAAQPGDIDIADGSVRRVLGDILQGAKKPLQPAIDTAAGGLLTTAAGSAYLTYLLRKKMREEPEKYMQESLPTRVELQPYK